MIIIMNRFFSKTRNRWAITDRMFLSLFLTGAIIEFSQVGAGFIDGIIISRFLGREAMAAEGIVHPLFSIFGIISGLFAVGMQTQCAQSVGRGDTKNYCRFVSATVFAGVVLSLICTALLVIFAKPFSILLGASGNASYLVEPASKYLSGLSLGAPALIMTAILAPAFQLDTGSRAIRTGAIIEAVSNVVLDIIAVRLGSGLFGVGLATAVASYLDVLFLLIFFIKKRRMLHFVKPDVPIKEFVLMLTNGSEKAIRRIANTLRPVIINKAIISYGGIAAVSALSVRNNFSNFAEIYGAGIASAVSLLTGVYYGEINEEGIEEVNKQEHKMILWFPCVVSLLILLFSEQITRLYIPENGGIFNMALFSIRFLAVQIPIQALIESRIKYLQAIQKKRNMALLTLFARLISVVISTFLLGKFFGSYGILACYTVSDALTLAGIYLYYAIRCHDLRPTRQDFLNLPDYFHLNPGDVISLDIYNQEDVCLGSEQIMLFCKGHKADNKAAYYAALSFEELASNIVRYGFPESSSSQPMIDLRAVITDNSLVIRLCDNCPLYDVRRTIAAVNESCTDPFHNIGTRIVSKTASDITYLNTFETNNLIISFKLNSDM